MERPPNFSVLPPEASLEPAETLSFEIYRQRRMLWYRRRFKNSLIVSANFDPLPRTSSVSELPDLASAYEIKSPRCKKTTEST